jgi:hypothetical protein
VRALNAGAAVNGGFAGGGGGAAFDPAIVAINAQNAHALSVAENLNLNPHPLATQRGTDVLGPSIVGRNVYGVGCGELLL